MYITGLASEAERVQVQGWLQQFPEVASELRKIEDTMEAYTRLHEVAPGKKVKENILHTLQKKAGNNNGTLNSSTHAYGVLPFWKRLAAAAFVLLMLSVVINLVFYNRYETERKNTSEAREELAAQVKANRLMKEDMDIVHNRYSLAVSLEGMPAAPNAAAKLFWMKHTGDVYVDATNLPEAPAGKQYQLWAIVDGKPVDGGMIVKTTKGDEYRIQKMKAFGSAEAFAITLEKMGGNPTPEGEMVVMGKM